MRKLQSETTYEHCALNELGMQRLARKFQRAKSGLCTAWLVCGRFLDLHTDHASARQHYAAAARAMTAYVRAHTPLDHARLMLRMLRPFASAFAFPDSACGWNVLDRIHLLCDDLYVPGRDNLYATFGFAIIFAILTAVTFIHGLGFSQCVFLRVQLPALSFA
ncbi:hypothetical protein VOLCADRAFT_88988 [Volvox carteri f. nagariensis]|uniref:Uncharacterized protein n=1 Tax=Volvox carteri f. nagariensis TaxID=3068 RepID=D8TQH6_VOLCA|nr:uncharacterized protein VOLCADRAFT_88988 [Volvox carteri f. nagariensis]EFJ50034.1 hypothetical protein VOLCADRAFT_88988 [Volvox carteri f. nagariensis]|eukprot:XP_002948654.1 hypothetical protein VOLCADRAFT_88988 [Volvox carteri f. nagariensis]